MANLNPHAACISVKPPPNGCTAGRNKKHALRTQMTVGLAGEVGSHGVMILLT
jgi:hypothetical protein